MDATATTAQAASSAPNQQEKYPSKMSFEKWKTGVITAAFVMSLSVIGYFMKEAASENKMARQNSEITKEKAIETNNAVIELSSMFNSESKFASEWRKDISGKFDKLENRVSNLEATQYTMKKNMTLAKKGGY